MKLSNIAEKIGLKLRNDVELDDIDIKSGYVGDLLSDVLANAPDNSLWFTVQKHQNIIAVADAKEIQGIVIVNNVNPDDVLLEKASKKGLPIFSFDNNSYFAAGKLYKLLENEDIQG
ncbi:MAG: hypothetical protein FXF47_07055 [Candidatus Mcinerneyibacterium aminivorans]|jgi:DNA-binding LacI/PurR family transcriptional regulator|uniref:Serine kinase n=1 Tax=Candidatus Mcinerneyibacterium aminivorans TaxID=2703815 RepID=A0A5D0MD61_9BACT|nr:MAG: hypothetical protein FXF47_07055 [Candidatus Mcinerneyibacterium aminivorans]